MKSKKRARTFCMVDPNYSPSGETFRELTLPGGQRVRMLNRQLFESAIQAADEKMRELLCADRAARKKWTF
jgi:hypothetical protein